MRNLLVVIGISVATFAGVYLIAYGVNHPVWDWGPCASYIQSNPNPHQLCLPGRATNWPFVDSGFALWAGAIVGGVIFGLTSLRRKPAITNQA